MGASHQRSKTRRKIPWTTLAATGTDHGGNLHRFRKNKIVHRLPFSFRRLKFNKYLETIFFMCCVLGNNNHTRIISTLILETSNTKSQ
uniref:Putative ovule protein n=1 Tax=Solanum chacoense TaxID=4108 RepID=A0A0V0H5U5_SOLCH